MRATLRLALASAVSVDWPTLWATSVHTAGYLLVTAVLAVVVYDRAALHLVGARGSTSI
jgi:hypothetical protein